MENTLEWGQIKPSQPPRRVARGANSGRHNGAISACHAHTSKLSHNNSSVAMHPTERIATPRRLRTALILPPMAVVASADEPSFSGKATHALHRLNGGRVGRSPAVRHERISFAALNESVAIDGLGEWSCLGCRRSHFYGRGSCFTGGRGRHTGDVPVGRFAPTSPGRPPVPRLTCSDTAPPTWPLVRPARSASLHTRAPLTRLDYDGRQC